MRPLAALAALAALPALATVNVNTAQQSELQSMRGLDKYQARTIIEYRNQNGPYRSLDDLAKALGEPATQKVASEVAFSGAPYVAPPHVAKSRKAAKKRRAGTASERTMNRRSAPSSAFTPSLRAPASR